MASVVGDGNFLKGKVEPSKNKNKRDSADTKYFHLRLTYEKIEEKDLVGILKKLHTKRIACQLEKGENGQLHYQITLEFLRQNRRSTVRNYFKDYDFQFPNIDYCEKCICPEKSLEYCYKEDTREKLILMKGIPKPLETIQDLRPYQQEIIDIVKTEPIARKIYWFFGNLNIGKSELLFKLCAEYGACILPNTERHALSQVFKTKDTCDTYILNLTADESNEQKTELFSILEKIKDRMFSAAFGTECNGMCLFNHKHLIVMANKRPQWEQTHIDRARFDLRYIDSDSFEFVKIET